MTIVLRSNYLMLTQTYAFMYIQIDKYRIALRLCETRALKHLSAFCCQSLRKLSLKDRNDNQPNMDLLFPSVTHRTTSP